VPATIALFIAPMYLLTTDPVYIVSAFIVQAIFGGSIYGQMPSYLAERFPTEVRATASGFIFHQGAIWGGLMAPVLTYLAVDMKMGFAMPMMISTMLFLVLVVIAALLGPETKGKRFSAELEVIKVASQQAAT
jgi:SHS family lactate transporter-like MFS transporter